MNITELKILLPEIVILSAMALVLIIGLFCGRRQSLVSYFLTQIALIGTAILVSQQINHSPVYALHNAFILDNAATLAKLFILIFSIFALGYAQTFFYENNKVTYDYCLLFLLAVMGMMTLVSSNHLIPLYLGLELLSLPLYALVSIYHSGSGAEAGMKYFVLGAFASALFLYGISLIFGATAQLELTALSQTLTLPTLHNNPLALTGIIFIIAALAFKLGAAPFHQWTPDVYEGAPIPVVAFISSAPKIGAIIIIIRLFGNAFSGFMLHSAQVWTVIAILSMALGNIAAIAQTNIRRMLAYSAVAHMGYMILGFETMSATGFSASLFYVMSYSLMTLAAFGALIVVSNQGFPVQTIEDLRGLNWRNPWIAFMILIIMFSMAGIPPSVGFFAKMGVLEALISNHQTWLAVTALVFAIIGSYYYLRVVKAMYFEPRTNTAPLYTSWNSKFILSINSLLILLLGIFPSFLIELCRAVYLK